MQCIPMAAILLNLTPSLHYIGKNYHHLSASLIEDMHIFALLRHALSVYVHKWSGITIHTYVGMFIILGKCHLGSLSLIRETETWDHISVFKDALNMLSIHIPLLELVLPSHACFFFLTYLHL